MNFRLRALPAVLAVVLASSCALLGCAGSREQLANPAIKTPDAIHSTHDFDEAMNLFVTLLPQEEHRSILRKQLLNYIVNYAEQSFSENRYDAAIAALETVSSLYTPLELKTIRAGSTKLQNVAFHLYQHAAKRGDEMPATFALALLSQFGPKTRKEFANVEWDQLHRWIKDGEEYSQQADRGANLGRLLETIAASFPSPWMIEKLEDFYKNHITTLKKKNAQFSRTEIKQRLEFLHYMRARLHLRADDIDTAISALSVPTVTGGTDPLKEILIEITENQSTAQPLIDLIDRMTPERPENLPNWVISQSWGIVDLLAQRALRLEPKNAHAHLARARSLRFSGFSTAAIPHYEQAIKKIQLFEAWSELAELYQGLLEDRASVSPDQAQAELSKIESFHRRSAETWHDRKVSPGVSQAYFTVAYAMYEHGQIKESRLLLEKSLELQPQPVSFDLLGTMALRQGKFDRARNYFSRLLELPFDDQSTRTHWEIRTRLQLAEVAIQSLNRSDAEKPLKSALTQLNSQLSHRELDDKSRSSRLLQRCRVFFHLGELDLAIADFREASTLTPERESTYSDSLTLAIFYEKLDEAREIYDHAIRSEFLDTDLKLYFSLWVYDLGSRRGNTKLAQSAKNYITQFDGRDWSNYLAQHARGEKSLKNLLQVANGAGERAEAYFYEALRRQREGNRESSQHLFHQVVKTGMMSYYEYEMAQHYLDTSKAKPAKQ